MALRADRPPDRRARLTRDLVLRAAVQVADADGLEAVTMRRLAGELGAEAMSLYYHVANKDDILDGIADLVVAEIELPEDGPDWKAAIRRTAVSAHEVLLRHPWACRLMMSPKRVRPARLRYMNAVLGRLREAGFSAELTHLAYHALDSHILGFALWEAGYALDKDDLATFGPAFARELPVDEYPHLAEHLQQHLTGLPPEAQGEFEFALDLILDGLERIRASA